MSLYSSFFCGVFFLFFFSSITLGLHLPGIRVSADMTEKKTYNTLHLCLSGYDVTMASLPTSYSHRENLLMWSESTKTKPLFDYVPKQSFLFFFIYLHWHITCTLYIILTSLKSHYTVIQGGIFSDKS